MPSRSVAAAEGGSQISALKVRDGAVTLQEGAGLGCHPRDGTEPALLFVLDKKLAFAQTQVQSLFEHVINGKTCG